MDVAAMAVAPATTATMHSAATAVATTTMPAAMGAGRDRGQDGKAERSARGDGQKG
jgi:hypothetical protein